MKRFALVGVALFSAALAARAADSPIYLPTSESLRLLATASESSDFVPLVSHFVSERHETYCGIASSVMVLNALGVPRPLEPEWYPYYYWNQRNIFTAEVLKAVPAPTIIEGNGVTLDQLATLLRTSGAKVERVFAQDTNLEAFRTAALDALRKPDTFLVINFDREKVEQVGIGHVSPIAAYNAEADRFLMLDVARYKYTPSWITAKQLYDAMLPHDSSSGKSRGYVIVSR